MPIGKHSSVSRAEPSWLTHRSTRLVAGLSRLTPSPRWRGTDKSSAFTRLELLAMLASLALLAVIALPVLAGNQLRSEQVTCLNNLRQIGRAMHIWGSDHRGSMPWRVPFSEGGLMSAPGYPIANVYFQLLWMSNELQTPKILACPSDSGAKVASTWGREPGGLENSRFMNNSVSYFVGLDAFPDYPHHTLSGDRNMESNGFPASCSCGLHAVAFVTLRSGAPNVKWSPGMHGDTGNILLYSGEVRQVTSAGLGQSLTDNNLDLGNIHFLYPR